MNVTAGRWAMRGLLLLVLSFANLNDIWSPDVLPNALLPFTLLRQGNVDYDEFVFRTDTTPPSGNVAHGIDSHAYFFRACGLSTASGPGSTPRARGGAPPPGPNDHVCSVFPPGMGFLAVPFFLPWVLAGANPLDLSLLIRVGHLAAAFYEALATLLLWAVLRRLVDDRAALWLVLLYVLGSSVRTIASQALWQHAGVHLAVAAALWLVIVERPIGSRRELLAGLAVGLGGVVRQTTALVAPFLPGAHAGIASPAGRRARAVAAALAGAALGLTPLVLFNAIVLGDPLEQGYGGKPFDVSTIGTGLVGLLVSPSRGLFVYEPWALLALASMVIAAFAKTTKGNISRRVSGFAMLWVCVVLLYATYAEWWGGRVFGPRFLDDLAPILIVGLAWGVRGGWFAYGAMRVLLWASAAWSVLLFNAAAVAYDQNTWDLVPRNVNDDPSRLFLWSDPQWLAVLRAILSGGWAEPSHAADPAHVLPALVLSALVLAMLLRVEGVLHLPARRIG